MDQDEANQELKYTPPPPVAEGQPRYLVARTGSSQEQRFVFYDRVEMGRDQEGRAIAPGLLLIPDDTISRRHCIVTQTFDGRCYVRDVSRNGTRIDGRRLVPNVETELDAGQTLGVGKGFQFVLAAGAKSPICAPSRSLEHTSRVPGETVATVLVGDIRDYTVLVRTAASTSLQRSVGRVFEILTEEVQNHGGTVKEYQGDAIFAFWEDAMDPEQVTGACRAALALDALTRRIAKDPNVWEVPDLPLKVDWALATGLVVIDSFGGRVPAGLSMVGEAVVLAFRIEKFANDETGPIVVDPLTRKLASNHFRFRDLGEVMSKGFDRPDQIFALIEPV